MKRIVNVEIEIDDTADDFELYSLVNEILRRPEGTLDVGSFRFPATVIGVYE